MRRTLYHRLALAIERKCRVMYFIGSKLFSCSYNHQIFAISNKHSTLTRPNKDKAILCVVYVQISSDIEDEVATILAIIDIKLLLFDRVNLLDSKCLILIDKTVVVRIDFFLDCLRLKDVGVKFWFLLDYLFRLLYFNWLFLLLDYGFTLDSIQCTGLFFFFMKLIF